MAEVLTGARLGWTILIICSTLLLRFLQKLHFHRSLYKGLPGPPRSYVWGSLRSMGEVIAQQPKRAAPQSFPSLLKDRYNLGDYFYLDPWPFGDPLLVILDTGMLHEVAVERNLPKHPFTEKFLRHFGGPGNLVSSEGALWKKWRFVFNPGFSTQHLMTLVPVIVDQCQVFCDIMTEHAENDVLFRMELATTKLTVDIIGKVVLDLSFDAQHGPNELVDTLIDQVRWLPTGAQYNPIELIDLRRPIILAYNTWKMNRYIGKRLDERFATRATRDKTKVVIDLALEAFLKEAKTGSEGIDDVKVLDPEFKRAAVNNIKTFLFAGHDTTSSTICYALYYLARDPKRLAKARQELVDVFGSDPTTIPDQLKRSPYLLNRLDYVMAVTREVLRLQPPASTVRLGDKDVFLRDPVTGDRVPTDHCMIWPVNTGFGRHGRYWGPDPHAFRPERYLEGDGKQWNREAWVPFSKGSRACIGQELAIIELKTVLAMTLCAFDFVPAYDELHKLRGDRTGYPSDDEGVQSQYGEIAYQIQIGTAKPREGLPCRVRARR